jgi:hypothetical protein
MSASAVLEHSVKSTVAEFTPVALWNLQYPGEIIVDRRGFTPKDDPATADEYQFFYGKLTVFSQDALDFVTAGRPYIVREDIPETSDPLVCDKCGMQTRSSRFYRVHLDKHTPSQ